MSKFINLGERLINIEMMTQVVYSGSQVKIYFANSFGGGGSVEKFPTQVDYILLEGEQAKMFKKYIEANSEDLTEKPLRFNGMERRSPAPKKYRGRNLNEAQTTPEANPERNDAD